MKTNINIPYSINLDLKGLMDSNIDKLKSEEVKRKEEFEANRQELLPFVLKYMHSYFELHNLSMYKDNSSTSGYSGIGGYDKIEIEKELTRISNKDYLWSFDGATFTYRVAGKEIKIWLSRPGKTTPTYALGYNMMSVKHGQVYGKSIESEIQLIAEMAAKHLKRLQDYGK